MVMTNQYISERLHKKRSAFASGLVLARFRSKLPTVGSQKQAGKHWQLVFET